MAKITNTAAAEAHPEWLGGGSPREIVAQEARGQSELVNSAALPTQIRGDRAILESAGVIFGEPNPEDPLFCDVTLPAGWMKRSTEHPLWSDLVDDQGTVRARIFYKAAFYDRDAFMSIAG